MIIPLLGAPAPQPDIINIVNKPAAQTKTEQKQTNKYTVKEGDTLSSIAKKHKTTWQRIWSKNINLNNQDVLLVGQVLTIPGADEVLTERPLYVLKTEKNAREPIKLNSEGNLYEPGQCTWYVKNRRPDIPNSWGDAYSWLGNAQAQGWSTGSVPVAGAIGWTAGHVVYIEGVRGNTVVISEMNYDWTPYHQRTIEMPAANYMYIY